MADKIQTQPSFTLNSADNHIIGGASDSAVGTIVIHAVSSAFIGSLLIKARAKGSDAAFVPIPYKRRNLGGVVSDDTNVTAALTAAFLIEVNAAGLDISLDCTAYTSGSLTVHSRKLEG